MGINSLDFVVWRSPMVKQSDRTTGIHIPNLKIDDYRGIRNLEIPRLAQVNLFAGETGLLRSSLLGYLVNRYSMGASAELHPYAWQSIRYVAKEETFYMGNPDLMATTTNHPRNGDSLPSVVIRHMNEDIIQFKHDGNVTRFFNLANAASVFKAGSLVDPRLSDEFNRPMRMPVNHEDRSWVSDRTPKVREVNGSYDYGYHFAESGVSSSAEFREVFPIGVDALRMMLIMSSLVYLSLKAENEGQVAVMLIDGMDVAVTKRIQEEFWKLIFGEAESRNLQLLVTTNSLDCIEGYADAGLSMPDVTAKYLRLEQSNDQTHYVDYDPYTLAVSFELNIDPR
jgi:hypothetical protein